MTSMMRQSSERKMMMNGRGLVSAVPCFALALVLGAFFCAGAATAQMDDIDRARRMHDRLAGVPPDDVTLQTMATDIGAGRADLAAELAMQHPAF